MPCLHDDKGKAKLSARTQNVKDDHQRSRLGIQFVNQGLGVLLLIVGSLAGRGQSGCAAEAASRDAVGAAQRLRGGFSNRGRVGRVSKGRGKQDAE